MRDIFACLHILNKTKKNSYAESISKLAYPVDGKYELLPEYDATTSPGPMAACAGIVKLTELPLNVYVPDAAPLSGTVPLVTG